MVGEAAKRASVRRDKMWRAFVENNHEYSQLVPRINWDSSPGHVRACVQRDNLLDTGHYYGDDHHANLLELSASSDAWPQ